MGVSSSERLKKLREQKSNKGESVSSSSNTSRPGDKLRGMMGSKVEARERAFIGNKFGLDTLEKDLSDLGAKVESIYGGWQTQETMANTKAAVEDMHGRLEQYSGFQKRFGGSDLTEVQSAYKAVLDEWEDLSKSYGKYDSTEEYQKALDEAKLAKEQYEKMRTSDLDEVKRQLDELQTYSDSIENYETEVQSLKNQMRTFDSRTRGYLETRNLDYKLKAKETEYSEFLKTTGYASTEELKKALNEQTLFYNNAKRIQNLDTLENIKNDANFQTYADKGLAMANESTGSWLNKSKKNLIAYYRTTPEILEVYDGLDDIVDNQFAESMQETIEYKAAKYMTDDQFAIYNAYMGSGDEEKATQYLDAIVEGLNYLRGVDIAESKDGLLDKLTFAADAGLSQFGSNVTNLFNNDDYIPQTSKQFASGMVRESLEDTGFELFGSSAGQIAYDVVNTTANMAPSILTSIAVNALAPGAGTVVGATLMGSSAAGGAYQEMLNLGYNKDQARTYSALVGSSEALMQYLLGGVSALGGKLTNNAIQSVVKGIDNAFLKFSLQFTLNGIGEGIEEGLQDIISPFFENLIAGYEKNKAEDIDWEQVAYSTMLGMLTSWAMEGSSDAVSYAGQTAQNAETGKNLRANDKLSNMADLFDTMDLQGLNSKESEAYRLYGEYLQKGDLDSISNAKLGKLYNTAMDESINTLKSKDTTDSQKKDAATRYVMLDEMSKQKTADEKARQKRVEGLKKGETTKVGDEATKLEGIKIEDGSTIVLTSQGEHKAEDMTFSSNDAEIVAYAENMGTEKGNLFIKNYDGNQNVDAYFKSFDMAYTYGEDGIGVDNAIKNKGVLTEKQVSEIYTTAIKQKSEARQKAIDAITAKYSAKTIKKGTFDDSIVDYNSKNTDGTKVNWNTLTSKQREAIRFAKAFSKATGVNIVFTKSKIKNGKHKGENGSYNPESNTITLDVYAGRMDASTAVDAIIPTLSHEVTHWMKAKAPEMYSKLQEKVMNTLGLEDGMSIEERIDYEVARIKRNHPENNVTPEDAIDEIVARACEDMLSNSEKARELLDTLTEKEKKTFMAKVEEIFNNLLEWVNNLLSQYKSESDEAEVLRKYEAKLKEAQKLWDEAFAEAVKANQALNKAGTTAEVEINKALGTIGLQYDGATKSVAPQMSERTWTESEYVVDREKAIENLSKALGVSKKKAEKYVDSINSVAKLIADDRARLDYDSNMDENASVMKPNSDYKWSVDMSTLCAKRLLFTGTFDAIQRMLPNTALDSDDIVKIRKMMMDKGYQVACGICYVESTRREIGTITQDFIERYKEAQKNGTAISRINSKGKPVLLQEKGTKKNFYPEDGYTPTLAELNTTDIDLVKRDHPEVYGAYLSYMNARGQAKPKLLETRAEYKGEIAKTYARKKNGELNSSTISMNESGGLRLQSFSDFEIAHLIDMMQVVMDMSNVGLMSQAYTKVPEFAEVFGNTGVKINLSLIAKGDGIDANGNLIFDDVEGIDHKRAFELRDKFSKNVGTILVGKNDAHIIKAMADPRIDYIIPFHKSSWKESLYDALGLTGYADYTDTQHEKAIDPDRKISDFKPSEYWDFTKSGDENGRIYLEKCKEDGRIPKFPQFAQYDGYWKLLIDFKMYDNDGVGSPQTSVMPEFDMEAANRILNDYEGGHRSFPVAKDIADEFVADYKKDNPNKQYSDRDSRYKTDNYYLKITPASRKDAEKLNMLDERNIARYRKEIDGVFDGSLPIGSDVIIGMPSEVLIEHGVSNRLIHMTQNIVRKIAYPSEYKIGDDYENTRAFLKTQGDMGGKHNLGISAVKNLPLQIAQPIAITKNNNANKGRNSVVLWTNWIAEDGKGIMLGLVIDSNGVTGLQNNVSTVFQATNEYAQRFFENEEDILYPKNKKDINQLLSSRRYMPRAMVDDTFIKNITQKIPGVKYSDRDIDDIDSRTLLANALESVAKNADEKDLLTEYRKNIDILGIKESELSEIKAEIKELSFAKGKRDAQRLEYLKNRAEKLQNSINYFDKKLLGLEAAEPLKNVIAREKARVRKLAYEKNREYTKKYMTSYKENVEKKANVERITQKALTLNKWLKENSKNNPIPEPFKPAVVQLLNAIDFSSRQKLGMYGGEDVRGTDTKKDMSIAKALEQVYKMAENLDKMRLEAENDGAFLNQLDFPPFFLEELKQLIEYTNNIADTVGDKYVLNQMSLEQLQNLDKIVSALRQAIKTANNSLAFADKVRISDTSEKWVGYLDSMSQKKTENLATEFLEYDNATPYYVFKRMGETGQMMFDALMDAQEKFAMMADEIETFAKETFTPEQAKKWSEELLEFEVLDTKKSTKDNPQYKTIKMTVAHAMSVYALSKREAAKGHLVGGGIRIKDFKTGKMGEKIKDVFGATLSKSELDRIINAVESRSDGAKEVADKLQNFMSTTCAKWGNEVTMRRWAIEQFVEDFYFPMETIKNGTNFDKLGSNEESIYSLVNANFTKALTPNADNKLVIDNIFDVFAKHTVEMAKYNSFALPTMDIIKVLGYSRKAKTSLKNDGDAHDTISVATSLTNAFGDGGLKYIVNLIKDLNGAEKTPRGEAITKKLMSNYKIQAVGNNLRVAMLQGTAYIKASLNMDTKYLLKALATSGKRGSKKALEYSGIALWKSKGHYDLNISRSVASRIKQDQTLTDKIKESSLYLAGLGDERTWGKIWNACEFWAEDNTKFQKGTEEFNKTVARRFRDVIVSTQVVDSTLTRSQMMRSKSAMTQTLTAFMSEGTMTYNMLADAFFEWSIDARQEGNSYKKTIGKHGRRFARTIGVWALTNVVVSAFAAGIDAVRDDDDDEKIDEKLLEAFFENLKDNLNPLGMLPIVKDIKSAFEGYSASRFDEQSFTTLYQAYKKWLKVFEGDGNVYKASYKTLQGLSQLSGLPISNAVRDAVAMWNTTVGNVYPSLKIK